MKSFRQRNSMVCLILIFMLLSVLLTASLACGLLAPVKIENKTSEVLTVYIDEYRIGDVRPNDEIKNNMVTYGHDWYLIEVYDTRGNVVYSHKFSEEEIKK